MNQVIPYQPQPVTMIPYSDLERMATAIAESHLFNVKDKTQALVLCLLAQAEGLHPAIAARDYAIIQGRPAKTAEAIQRSFLLAGGKIEWHRLDDEVADATFSHPQGGTFRCNWDIPRATQAGLALREQWKKFPRAMLRARCVSEGCRTVWPGATAGLYTPDEIRDVSSEQKEKEIRGEILPIGRYPAKDTTPIGEGSPQHAILMGRLDQLGIPKERVIIWCSRKWGITDLTQLTTTQFSHLMEWLPRFASQIASKENHTESVPDSAPEEVYSNE